MANNQQARKKPKARRPARGRDANQQTERPRTGGEFYRVGNIVDGEVVGKKEYGLFIRLDPETTGLLHKSELSWDDPSEILRQARAGQKARVKVIKITPANGRISLSLRQAQPNPVAEYLKVNKAGSVVLATIASVSGRTTTVQLAPKVTGEIETTSLFSSQDLARSAPPSPGEPVWVRVADLQPRSRQIWLTAEGLFGSLGREGIAVPLDVLRAWVAEGMGPEAAGKWWKEGWAAEAASPWIKVGFRRPKPAREWAARGVEPIAAAEWHDISPAFAQPWIDAGLDGATLRRWAHHMSAELAVVWMPTGLEPDTAAAWHGAGFEPDEVGDWRDAGFEPADAGAWRARGTSPGKARAWASRLGSIGACIPWMDVGVSPVEAQRLIECGVASSEVGIMRDAGINAIAAVEWLAAGVHTPELARRWIDGGVQPELARVWLGAKFEDPIPWAAAGWRPEGARRWADAGLTDAVEAMQWSENGWRPFQVAEAREIGIEPTWAPLALSVEQWRRVAGEFWRTGKNPEDGDVLPPPPGFRSRVAVQPRRVRDRLLGSPRSSSKLREWQHGNLAGSAPVGPSAKQHKRLASWVRPNRLKAENAMILRDRLLAGLRSGDWQRSVASSLSSAQVVLADAMAVNLHFEAEPPPRELLPEIRLPWPSVLLLFTAAFEFPGQLERGLPGWDPESERAVLSYEPWLHQLSRGDGALVGVLLQSGKGGGAMRESVAWVVAVEGCHALVPGFRSESAFDGVLTSFAAAICFGGWAPSESWRQAARPSRRRAAPKQLKPRPDHPHLPHVVDIRGSARNAQLKRWASRGSAPHTRRAHWHRYRVGPRDDWEYEWRWIEATYVNGAVPRDHPGVVYRLPRVLFR